MEPIEFKPEKEQKKMWFIGCVIPFALGLALWVVLLLTVDQLIFSFFIAGWLIIMLPILSWIPAFYKSCEYIIDRDSVQMRKGVFWRKHVEVPYTKITNVDVTQGPLQRTFDIGTIHIQTAGAGGPQGAQAELKLLGVRELDRLKEKIMARIRGYDTPGTEEKEAVAESDSEIFTQMLKELTAIREALEKK